MATKCTFLTQIRLKCDHVKKLNIGLIEKLNIALSRASGTHGYLPSQDHGVTMDLLKKPRSSLPAAKMLAGPPPKGGGGGGWAAARQTQLTPPPKRQKHPNPVWLELSVKILK